MSGLKIGLGFLCLIIFLEVRAQAPKKQFNVIVILSDDVGYKDLGSYGSSFYETPHLDALASDGMRFTRAYAAAPVCSPTRSSILSGKYPINTGITNFINPEGNNTPERWSRNTELLPAPFKSELDLSEFTIAEAVTVAGYKTYFAGKWHLGGEEYLPTNQGFSVNKGGYDAGHPKSYFSPYQNPELADGPDKEYLPERLAEETAAFIHENRDSLFFIYHSLYLAHTPLRAKDSLVQKYEQKRKLLGLENEFGQKDNTKVRIVQSLPVYAAMIEAMDNVVGRIVAQLKQDGLYENTILIFTSDNGGLSTSEGWPTSNLPLRGGKGWLYEGGIRVPLLVRWPGITQSGSSNNSMLTSPDIYPTVLDMLKLPQNNQQQMDGISFVKTLQSSKVIDRALYWHYPHYSNQGGSPASSVMDKKWKLIKHYDSRHRPYELYNIKKDWSENNDLSLKKKGKVKRMSLLLQKFLDKNKALSPTPNPNYKSMP